MKASRKEKLEKSYKIMKQDCIIKKYVESKFLLEYKFGKKQEAYAKEKKNLKYIRELKARITLES